MPITDARVSPLEKPEPLARFWKPSLVIALCASYALYCLATIPSGPISAPDSAGYLGFAPLHTLGYPVFLRLLGAKGAIVAQPILFAIAAASLGFETLRLTSSVVLTLCVILGSMIIPGLTTYHVSILSESLFMSGLVAFLAAGIRFVRAPSWHTAVLAGAIAGLIVTVRRTGLALLPVLVIMVLLEWRRLPAPRWAILAAATAPMLALAATERSAARAIHGDQLTSLTGRHLYAKAALIEAPLPSRPAPDPLRARLEEHLAVRYAPIRDFIERAPPDLRSALTLYYEGCLQGPCVPELGESVPWSDGALGDVLARVGRERIARAPLNFVKLTAVDYRSLWTAYKLRHPGTTPVLNAFIASNRPLPFEKEAFRLSPQDTLEFQPFAVVRFVQPVVVVMGWVTAGFALLGLVAVVSGRPLSEAFSVAALASLTAHGCLLFSALLAAGLSRFMISLWPAITTAVLIGAWGTGRVLFRTETGTST